MVIPFSIYTRETLDPHFIDIHAQAKELLEVAYNVQPPRPDAISHEVAIDTFSTLGQATVAALLEHNSPISDWPDQSKQRVMELAALRSASVSRVRAQFPQLFDIPANATRSSDVFSMPHLQESFALNQGSLPVLITAPHNGWRTSLGDQELPRAPHSKAADGATRFIAQDVHRFLQDRGLPAPTILIDAVHRAHRTPQTRAFFEYKTYEALCNLRHIHDSAVLHLDVHGFGDHPEADDYDLILGTAHRKTVGDSMADHDLATFAAERGYQTYLPGPQPRSGEVYTAKSPATLVQRVAQLALEKTASIQLEISSDFRTKETQARGEQLAHDLGTFCVAWAKSSLKSELAAKS